MKKKLILTGIAAFLAAVTVTGFSAYNQSSLSDLLNANVEALAGGEDSNCPNGCNDYGGGCYCNGWYEFYREA